MSPEEMISCIRERYGLTDEKVLSAMLRVPREKFIPPHLRQMAYEDGPVYIGHGQTISQPYTVAFMTHLVSSGLRPSRRKKVLEVGTGSGYQAAILSLLFDKVFTIEIIPELAQEARKRLKNLGYKNVEVRVGSGEFGWRQESPFDAILVTAGMEEIPQELFRELKDGGVLVAPVGAGTDKEMTRYRKQSKSKFKKEGFGIFHFVPFVESN